MKIRLPLAVSLFWMTSLIAFGASPETSKLEAMYNKAFKAFDSARYEEALTALDAIDAKQPNLAESLNLRGVVYMRQGKYDKAEAALRKALSLEPKFWNASFNLAEIPFLKKNWAEARTRFEALISGDYQGMQSETAQLIQYKILLTFILQGKDNTAESMIKKFEQAKNSPAQYFAHAAIAFQHGNQKEANEWLSAAEKRFPGSRNKLYSESFYEIGWMQKAPGEGRAALEIASTDERADRLKADAQVNFEKAERAFQERNLDEALSLLDQAEAALPNDPANQNLRGEIFLEQKKYDQAEAQFQKAFATNPKFREAEYNLAQIPFKKGDYDQARNRFEALFAETPGDEKNQASQLIRYKVFLTLLLQGKDEQAQQLMDQFKFTGDTPALYYAHAAWEFKHDNPDRAADWLRSAGRIYSPALNIVFSDSFYDLGWLNQESGRNLATTSILSEAQVPPPIGPSPAMRLGPAEDIRPPSLTEASDGLAVPGESPGAATITATVSSVEPSASPASSAAPNPAATASVAPVVAGASAPPLPATPSVVPRTVPSVAPVTESSVTPVAASSRPPVIANPVATSSPVSKISPTQEEALSPTRAELSDLIFRPGNLLIAVLLLAGIVFLVWMLGQNARRNLTRVEDSSTPLTEPALAREGDRSAGRKLVANAPPKLSPNLEALDTAGRAALSPGAVRARESTATVTQPPAAAPNESRKEAALSIASVAAPAAAERATAALATSGTTTSSAAQNGESATLRPEQGQRKSAIAAETAPAKMAEPPLALPNEIRKESPIPSIASVAAKATEPMVPPVPAAPAPAAEPVPEKAAVEPAKSQPEPDQLIPQTPVPAFAATSSPVPELPKSAEAISFAPKVVAPTKMPEPAGEVELVSASEPLAFAEEPVKQGQPIPELTTAFSPEPVLPELTRPEPESPLELIEPEDAVAAPIAGHRPVYSAIETPSFASKIISTEPIRLQPTTFIIMPETTITPAIAPTYRTPSPTMSVQQPAGGMHTAVQLIFSLEIASMQLTPTFKMSGVQLKPTSKVVSMRLAPSQDPQPPMNLQVTFEVAKIELSNGNIGTVRLAPSAQQKPAVLASPSFAISGLELVAGSGSAPVQLTPSHQEQASVQLMAEFQIAAIEFTPLFEISAIVLNSSSRKVSMQLPGTGSSSIEGAPVFEIENVQLGPGNELGLIQVTPGGRGA